MPRQMIQNLPYWVKMAVSTITIIGTLVGVVIAVEDRYVDQQEITMTLTAFDNKLRQELIRVDLRILNMQYDQYTEHYYSVKRDLRETPSDLELGEELEQYRELRQKTKDEINVLIK